MLNNAKKVKELPMSEEINLPITKREVAPASSAKPQTQVLVVDDERVFLTKTEFILQRKGYQVFTASDPREVLQILDQHNIDVVLTDIQMPHVDGIELCKQIKAKHANVEVVVVTATDSTQIAVQAIKAGAYDFLTKPLPNPDVMTLMISKAIERKDLLARSRDLENQVALNNQFEMLLGKSRQMKDVFRLIERVAPTDSSILIAGESGTGKELVARAIHERSRRRSNAFFAVNCSAFVETLLESELFGHAKGAFTGATSCRKGLFEEADGGTLFLDEIGEMPISVQAKFLRVLQTGEIKPLGSNSIKKVDVRILTATNVDLPKAVAAGLFREDLFYRINVISVALSPLRDRLEDIPLLAHHFVKQCAKKAKEEAKTITSDAITALTAYRWPGNVRELENAIERAVILSPDSMLRPKDLPTEISSSSHINDVAEPGLFEVPFRDAKRRVVAVFEKQYLEKILTRSKGIIAEAARLVDMDRANLRRLLTRHSIDVKKYRV